MADRGVPETYAGPAMRLGLFYADHATCDRPRFRTCRFGDIDPEGQHGADLADVTVVVCTITWTTPDGTHHDSNGWVPVPFYEARRDGTKDWLRHHADDKCQQKGEAHDARVGGWIDPLAGVDMVDELQTKAQGRALKRAGYAADTKDLQAVIAWRHRVAEVEATREGKAAGPKGQREAERALAAAGQSGDTPDRPEAGDREVAPDPAQSRVQSRQEGSDAGGQGVSPSGTPAHQALADRIAAAGLGRACDAYVQDKWPGVGFYGLSAGQLRVLEAWVKRGETERGVNPAKAQETTSAPQAPAGPADGGGAPDPPEAAPNGAQGATGSRLGVAMAELDELSKVPDGDLRTRAISDDLRKRGWPDAVQQLDEDQLKVLLDDIIPAHMPF